ncbi:MAG: BofC C-terminal domain-containing protein [Clostridia bacterium]|nr:BofC C-terminal domain-containing protein [Clostridia bacterium]
MNNLKEKLVYCLVLVMFLVLGVGFGYVQTVMSSDIKITNTSMLDYATSYIFPEQNDILVAASTHTYDVEVMYEDNYLVCNEKVLTTKTVYGTTMDKVKEDEKAYQEEKGIVYKIKGESAERIIYTREINENCPNHFWIILEDGKINVYSVQGENKRTLFRKIENINIDNLREELRIKVEKGTSLNSKDELNKFIEDLES